MKLTNGKIILCLLAFIISVCGCTQSTDTQSLGSANTPEGKTVVVSVFVNDATYSWDFSSKQDKETKKNYLDYMGIATDYLVNVTKEYDKESSYIYDFNTYPDLYYETTFKEDIANEDPRPAEEYMNAFLDQTVDSTAIKEEYEADNIIYFMVLNTDTKSKAITCTRNYYEGMKYPYEIVFLYNIDSGLVNPPAVYAHEMLHTFGAPDLYTEDSDGDGYGITEEFINYVQTKMPNDLMYTCTDLNTNEYVYDQITNEVSELDAYYVGLTDSCKLVDEFNLKPSQHIRNQ